MFAQVLKWGKGNPYHAKSGLFTSKDKTGLKDEFVHGPSDAVDSILNGESVSIDRNDVRSFLKKAQSANGDPNLTQLHVEGMKIFGGDGLGIKRADMPQIPRALREDFLKTMEGHGVKFTEESVDPLTLRPTQKEISASDVAEKLANYEKGEKKFPPLLVSNDGHVLDGHHHWGMMAAVAIESPKVKVPIIRFQTSTKRALGLMHQYDKDHGIGRKKIGQRDTKRKITILKSNLYHDKAGLFASKDKDAGHLDVSSWKKVGAQGGSNPGGVFEDSHGTRHYVKFPQRNPEQANTEKLADDIYRALGIPVKDSQLVTSGGKLGLAGKMLTDSKEIGKAAVNQSADVKAGYVADAYLASWDVFGMTYDNILRHGERDYRVDNGGTMFFRAQGEKKPFPSDKVNELDSLIAPGKKGHEAFAGLTAEEKTNQARHLATTLTDDRLVQLIAQAGLKDEKAREYFRALSGRRDVIAKRFSVQKADAPKKRKYKYVLHISALASKLGWQDVEMDVDEMNRKLDLVRAVVAKKDKKKKKKKSHGFQEVPMDIDKIEASLAMTQKANRFHDKHGLFTSKEHAAPAGPAQTLAAKHAPAVSAERILAKELPDESDQIRFRDETRIANELHDSGRSTKQENTKPGTNAYTKARLELHDEIIDTLLGSDADNLPPPGEKPRLIMVGGRTGSGKGNFSTEKSDRKMAVYDPKKNVVLDPDTVKGMLPGYEPKFASLYHKESVDIFNKAVASARQRGLNVVLDFTMSSDKTALARSFKKRGYSIEAHYVHRPAEKAAGSAIQRWKSPSEVQQLDGSVKTFPHGRLVPIDIVLGQKDNEKHFDKLSRMSDRWTLYDNSKDRHEPMLVSSSDGSHLSRILKSNPYKDAEGKFTDKAHAVAPGWYKTKGGHHLEVGDQGTIVGGSHAGKTADPQKFALGPFKSKTEALSGKHATPPLNPPPFSEKELAAAKTPPKTAEVAKNLSVANLNEFVNKSKFVQTQGGVKNVVAHIGKTNLSGETTTVNPTTGLVEMKYDHGFFSTDKAIAATQAIKDYYTDSGFTVVTQAKNPGEISIIQQGSRVRMHAVHAPKADPAPPVVSEKAKQTVQSIAPKVLTPSQLTAKEKQKVKQLEKYTGQYEEQYVTRTIESLDLKATGKHSKADSKLAPLQTLEKTLVQYGITPENMKALQEKVQLQVEKQAQEHYAKTLDSLVELQRTARVRDAAGIGEWQTNNPLGKAANDARAKYTLLTNEHPGLIKRKGGTNALREQATVIVDNRKFLALRQVAQDVSKDASEAAKNAGASDKEIEAALFQGDLNKALKEPIKQFNTTDEAAKQMLDVGVTYHNLKSEDTWSMAEEKKKELQARTLVAQAKYELAKTAFLNAGGTPQALAKENSTIAAHAQNVRYELKKAQGAAQDKAKLDLQKLSHDYHQALFEHGPGPKSAAALDALNAGTIHAGTVGFYSPQYEIDSAIALGKNEWDATIKTFKDIATKKVKDAVFEYEYAVTNGAPADKLADLKSHMDHALRSESKYFPSHEIDDLVSEQRKLVKDQKDVLDRIASLGTDIKAKVQSYDKLNDEFQYPNISSKDLKAASAGKDFKAIQSPQIKTLTADEKHYFDKYSGSAFTPLNRAAGAYGSSGKKPTPTELANIRLVDGAMAKVTLGANVRLNRGMSQRYLAQAFGMGDSFKGKTEAELQALVGKVYTEGAFSSTSMNETWSSSFTAAASEHGKALLKIRAGKDTRGIRIASFVGEGEGEVLLDRGTTYVIRKVTLNKGKYGDTPVFEVDVIGQVARPLP